MIVIVIAKTPSTANPTAKNSQSSAWGLGSNRGRLACGTGSFAREGERERQREEGGESEKEERGLGSELAGEPRSRGQGENGAELLDRAAQANPRARPAAVRDRIGEGGEGEAGKGEAP